MTTTPATQALLPCPFCGGEAGLVGIRDGFMVACKAGKPCFARGPSVFHGPGGWDACRAEAITAWNTRQAHSLPGDETQRAALERLSKLTPFSANAATAEDFAATVHAIADTALTDTKGDRSMGDR